MVSAFVFIQVSKLAGWSDAVKIHKDLHAVPGVKTVHFVAGPTDIVVYVDAADQNALMQTVGKLNAVKGVGHTDTRIVLPI